MSNLAALLRQGEFVVTAELNPPKGASGAVVKRRADVLKGNVDAVNVTDSNRGIPAMAAIPAALFVRESGVEPIVQVTGRDRNRIALQADLLGASALGIANFLFMSGDDPKHGNHPDAVHVKDLDGVGLVKMAVTMRDQHKFLSGDEIRQAPDYFIGATTSPFTKPMSADLDRTVEKINSGADFLQTQPVFDLATFSQWLAELRRVGGGREAAVIAGVLVLRSADQAERLARVPGITLGQEVIDRIKKASDGEQEGLAIAIEMVKSLRALPGVHGVHMYAIESPEAIVQVIERAGLLPRPKVRSDP
ncbi:MAG TPA: methylenetetrahydrofolate reductase [Candidatus Limnocylindria bacterium]|nr:methylenetetrahydrofolate reductase [Candidatus Limnocylindria bacterium]